MTSQSAIVFDFSTILLSCTVRDKRLRRTKHYDILRGVLDAEVGSFFFLFGIFRTEVRHLSDNKCNEVLSSADGWLFCVAIVGAEN